MATKFTTTIILLFATLSVFSQDQLYNSLTIPEDLKNNANAVVRHSELEVVLESSNEMIVREKRIITVLNKQGDKTIDAYVHYDKNVKIKELQALVFNGFGAQIKKIKKNDFKDVSAVNGGTLYSDSRVKYLDYIPINYPYTIEFTYETESGNTAFLPSFFPVDDFFVSTESSSYTITYPPDITIRKKESNLEGLDAINEDGAGKIYYKVNHVTAFKPEAYGPSFRDMIPKVMFASKQFALEGVETEVEDWNDFAKWMYNDLIKITHDLPESTISLIRDLVKEEKTNVDKAKKIYQYVQDKVRYISVQVGIGGWKPFNASEVDRLSYGDCKALTNYTMALLDAANIKSNYSVVYAGDAQRSIEKDFVSIQGNHVILSIPNNDETVWLECTSQKLPFGFIGDFTDDRDVLVITPEGGKIQHTKKYTTEENTQYIKGSYTVSKDGIINVNVNVSSKGIQYNDKYWLESETKRDLDEHYKKRWRYVNNININSMDIVNDKDSIEFKETLNFQATNYPKIVANRMLLTVNALNRNTHVPDRYRNRKLPLKIKRGFTDVDEVEIILPQGYKVEALPHIKTIENKFGSYKAEVLQKDDNTLIYIRKFIIKDGEFPKEDYKNFRSFYKEVSRQDNAKVVLIKA